MGVPSSQYVVVIGYGVPGRAVVDLAKERGAEICVVEQNANTVKRCKATGLKMIVGDARLPATLEQAELARASVIAIAIPDEEAALQVTRVARAMNAVAKIITRCHYTSAGFQAKDAGADEVVVAETVVANEMSALVSPALLKPM
jgi:Trk K+ transport system NAD-binding subunit